jgi:ABC-type transporter Mla subunit MlaD
MMVRTKEVLRVRKVLIVLVMVLAALALLADPAGAIVHGFTPVECATSGNAGGVPAAGHNPQFAGQPIPVTSSDGRTQGQANSAPVGC